MGHPVGFLVDVFIGKRRTVYQQSDGLRLKMSLLLESLRNASFHWIRRFGAVPLHKKAMPLVSFHQLIGAKCAIWIFTDLLK